MESDNCLVEIPPSYRIAISGFNTAWSSSKDKEKGKVWIGAEYQLGMLSEIDKKCDLRIALCHHPFGWLVEEEEPLFRDRITQEYSFHLTGHEHHNWVNINRGHVQIESGAIYSPNKEELGYNIVRVNMEKRTGEIWLRRFQDVGWIPRIIPDTTDNKGVVSLKIRRLAQTKC